MLSDPCFLCEPDSELVYAASERFFAILGLGPLSAGYSLIASRAHSPSMFDLSVAEAHELADFTREVRSRLEQYYGPSVITEHGRVPPCLGEALRRHEPHCLHAHRLVFPGVPDLDLSAVLPASRVRRFDSFLNAKLVHRDSGQYLYAEDPDGTCEVASVCGGVSRQFFRRLVASRLGIYEYADWQLHPRYELVAQARKRLQLAA
jgi:hypothetical protein